MKYLKFAVGLIFFLIGCTSEKTSIDFQKTFSWVFQDSIQVAYMEELFLLDYDPKEELYLGRWNAQEEYVLFDESGQIKHTFKLSEDGLNTIGLFLTFSNMIMSGFYGCWPNKNILSTKRNRVKFCYQK